MNNYAKVFHVKQQFRAVKKPEMFHEKENK